MFGFSTQRCILLEFLTFSYLPQSSDFIGRLGTVCLALSQCMLTSVFSLVSISSPSSLSQVCNRDSTLSVERDVT